jgi:hypothetical protein
MEVEFRQNKSGVKIWQVIIRLTLTMQHLSRGLLVHKVALVGFHLIILYHQQQHSLLLLRCLLRKLLPALFLVGR